MATFHVELKVMIYASCRKGVLMLMIHTADEAKPDPQPGFDTLCEVRTLVFFLLGLLGMELVSLGIC